MPFITPHVVSMPDVHCGIGSTFGAVIPTERAIYGKPKAGSAARTSMCWIKSPRLIKNIDEVMSNQSDLVAIVHTLKQDVCVKG